MALTKRYVRADAAGGGDGTTDANSGANGAFTWAEMITDINTPRVGYKYLVKSGTYANGTTSTVITGDGTTTSPNVIEGFSTTEGDLNDNGRSSGGALNTTNFPAISYTGTTARFDASGANYLVIRCLSITSAASAYTTQLNINCTAVRVQSSNTSTNSAAAAFNGGADIVTLDCDFATASTGALYAVRFLGSNWYIEGCRIKCVAGTGLLVRSSGTAKRNTIYECTTGIATDNTSSQPIITDNTIVNCTGDGIDIITSSVLPHTITGNHITGCGGYAIDFNTSTCQKRFGHNRFRDNTSGNINGGGDWEEGTSVANVTSDDTDSLDFTDASTDDYSLKAGAAATSKGIGYLIDIGAHGSPVVTGGGSALHLGSLGQTGIGAF